MLRQHQAPSANPTPRIRCLRPPRPKLGGRAAYCPKRPVGRLGLADRIPFFPGAKRPELGPAQPIRFGRDQRASMKHKILTLVLTALLACAWSAQKAEPALAAPTQHKSAAKASGKAKAKTAPAKKSAGKKSGKKSASKSKRARGQSSRSARRSGARHPAPGGIQAVSFIPTPGPEEELLSQDRKKADDLLMSALGLLGVSYRWGGSNPVYGVDCSGFIQFIFKQSMNITLPRTSAAMATVGLPVDKGDLMPGDLVFFGKRAGRVDHVGMYMGDGQFIHSPHSGKAIEMQSLNTDYYAKHYITSRRIPSALRAVHDAES